MKARKGVITERRILVELTLDEAGQVARAIHRLNERDFAGVLCDLWRALNDALMPPEPDEEEPS